jgi:hypothetical protein
VAIRRLLQKKAKELGGINMNELTNKQLETLEDYLLEQERKEWEEENGK